MKIVFPSSRTDSDRAGLDTHRFDAPIFRATTPAATRTARFGRDRASSHWRGRSAFRRPSESPNAFSGSRHPRRSPSTDRGCIRQRQRTDATGVADSTRSRRQRGIGKTSADKTSTRRPPENISKTSRRRHENHRQRRGCAGETRALAVRSDRWSLALRRSAAHEPPAAREPPQQASLLEHEGHQRTPSIGQTARGKPGGLLKTHRAPKAF